MAAYPLYHNSDRNGNESGGANSVMALLGLRQLFCDHEESFAYRKYDDFDFVEYCRCRRCGKVLKSFKGFDEDVRG